MTSDVQIVAVQSDEQYRQVHQLILEYAASRNFDAALSKLFTELDHLADYYTLILLAYYEQEPAGCVAIQPLEEGICEMKRLYVKPAFRKAGIGKLLVERLIAESVTKGFQRMRLDTHPNMLSAHQLYRSFGFREIERYNQNPIPGIRFFELQLATGV
jgi:ribosomal protein S18 acetylase RimI-like enzyme